jgi:DNA repair exonuclease SbcCD ATPase subunit
MEGFRAINNPLQIKFGDRATLLFAPNGQGKTSLLAAIEWCLFGKLAYQIPENLTNDEVVNMQNRAGEAYVRLDLKRGTDDLVVERRRRVGKREMSLRVTFEGQAAEGLVAENLLFRLLGLTFDDFYRAAFLHQESVRGLLVEEPRVRNEAFDRLFGLDKLRDILAAIQIKPVTDAIEEIQGKQRRAFDRLSGASQQLEMQRARHLQDAQSLGLTEPDITLEDGRNIATQVLNDLKEVCLKSGMRDPELPKPETVDDLERTPRKVKEVIRDGRLGVSTEVSITAVSRKVADIEGAKVKIESATLAMTEAEEQLDSHEKVHGSDDDMDKRRADLESKRSQTRGAIAAVDATTRLLSDAIEVIRADPSLRTCPVCGQQVHAERVIESLDNRLHGAQRAEHDRKVLELNEVSSHLDVLNEAIKERTRFRKVFSDAHRACDRALADARTLMPELPDRERALRFVDGAVKAARDELERATRAQSERNQALDDLDQSVDRLRALKKVVKDDE